MAGYEWRVSLESQTGFVLDTDLLDTGVLGFLNTPLTDSRVKIRSVSVQGGTNRELDKIPPSTATIVFDNRDGLFNPDNTSSPYYGQIFPGKTISLEYVNKVSGASFNDALNLFYGVVTDWSFGYDVSGDATATVSAKDLLGLLAGVNIPATSVPQESSEARFKRICTLAGFNSARVLSGGSYATLAAATIQGDALQLAQDVVFQEQGYTAVIGDAIYFQPRNSNTNLYGVIFSNYTTEANIWNYSFTDLQMAYSNDTVANSVTTTSSLGTAIVTDSVQVAKYGKTSAQYDVSYSTLGQQIDLTNFLVNFYGAPQFRPESMTISIDSLLTAGDQLSSNVVDGYAALYFLSIAYSYGFAVRVLFDPPGSGDIIDKKLLISSWSHSSTPSGYNVTIGFQPNPFQDVFILDSATFGILNTNKLGF